MQDQVVGVERTWVDRVLFWVLLTSALVGWGGLAVFILMFVSLFSRFDIPHGVFLVVGAIGSLGMWVLLVASLAALVLWIVRVVRRRAKKAPAPGRVMPFENKVMRIGFTIFFTLTFIVFLLPAVVIPALTWPRLGQRISRLVNPLPHGEAGIVRVSASSAKRVGENDYRIEIYVENTLPWGEPDAEMYLGGAGSFSLEDAHGREVLYKKLDIDYRGHEDYIEAGDEEDFVLTFRDVVGEPAVLVFQNYYTDDKSIRVNFERRKHKERG